MSATNGTQFGTQFGTQLDQEQVEKILSMIRENNRVTRKQMAKALSVSLRTIQRILNEMNNVRYIGSGSGGHWEIEE